MSSKEQRIQKLLTQLITEAETDFLRETTNKKDQELFIESYVRQRLLQEHPELLQEGWKEIALALGLLTNTIVGGPVKALAQKAVKSPTVVQQVEQILDNPEELDKVADYLEQIGYKNADEKIEANAIELKKQLDKKSTVLTPKTVKTPEKLTQALEKGYALRKIERDTILKQIREQDADKAAIDSMAVTKKAGDIFQAGGFGLKEDSVQYIANIVEQIHNQEGVVLGVKIVSSTDKQRVSENLQKMLEEKGYSSNNQGLSEARNDAVKQALAKAGLDTSIISQEVLYEQGKGKVGATEPQDPSARYVRFIIDAIDVSKGEKEAGEKADVVDKVVTTFKLVKAKKIKPPKLNPPVDLKIFKKCNSTTCPTF